MHIRTFEGLGLGEPKDVLVAKCRAWVVNAPFKKERELTCTYAQVKG
jgi:hypothetical protein